MSTPLENSSSNIQTEKLVFKRDTIEVRHTVRYYLLLSSWPILGLVVAFLPWMLSEKPNWFIVVLGYGNFILGLGALLLAASKKYPLLELSSNLFYPKGAKHPDLALPLYRLAHLELLSKEIVFRNKRRTTTYTCYELNLVFADGTRHNLLNHGGYKAILRDAERLSQILNRPLRETPPPNGHRDRPFTRKERIGVTIFGMIFIAAGLFIAYLSLPLPIQEYMDSKNWVATPATITLSGMRYSSGGGRGGSTANIQLHYTYTFQGNTYEGKRYDFFRSRPKFYTSIGMKTMRNTVAAHPVGATVTCLVNPDNPGQSVISRKWPAEIWWYLFPFPFIAFGLLFCYVALKPQTSRPHFTHSQL